MVALFSQIFSSLRLVQHEQKIIENSSFFKNFRNIDEDALTFNKTIIQLQIFLSIFLCQRVFPSICLSVFRSIFVSVCLSIFISFRLFVGLLLLCDLLSTCLFICSLSVCLPVCFSVFVWQYIVIDFMPSWLFVACISVYLTAHLSLSIYLLSTCLPAYQTVYRQVSLLKCHSDFLSVYMSIFHIK
jgi:hypothetical protein